MIPKKYIKLLACSKYPMVRKVAWKFIKPHQKVFYPSKNSTRLLFAGDTSFDNELRFSPYGVCKISEKNNGNKILNKLKIKIYRLFFKSFFDQRLHSIKHYNYNWPEVLIKNNQNIKKCDKKLSIINSKSFDIEYDINESKFDYPFKHMSLLFKSKDHVIVNLETALAKKYRVCGLLISEADYAEAMKNAGISSVCIANNHIFDAGENGFRQTLAYLNKAGISYSGAGNDLEKARRGNLLQLNEYKITVLNYTNYCNSNFTSIASDYPGILPLDRNMVVEDIEKAAIKSDFVFLSLHWGIENQPNVHPKQVEYAHFFIDAGADAIIGHHPHIPHGIEVYKGKPIIYSLGNFIFGRGQGGWKDNLEWTDNFLAELVIDNNRLQGVIIYPISGRGKELFQPKLLKGDRADNLLKELQIKSAVFDTGIAVDDGVGYIKL